jgi:hypothetical protein
MSHIIGSGNRGVVGQQAAAQRAAQLARQQSAHIAQQNMLRQQMMNRQYLTLLAQEVIQASPTQEDVDKLTEIVQEAEQQGLAPEQVEAKVRENGRIAWILPLLPQNRAERIAYLALLVEIVGRILEIIALVVGQQPAPPQPSTITPEQMQEVVDQLERVVDQMEQEQRSEPTPPEASPIPRQQLP